MQIKMQAVLTQSELEEAVRLYVRQELPAAADQNVAVSFEDDKDGNLTAVVVIDNAEGAEAPVASQKPKTTRKKASAPATAAAEQASEQKTAETTAAVQEDTETAAEAAQDLPWKEDEAQTTVAADESGKPVTQANEIPAETSKLFSTEPAATSKIFPDAGSSAAPVVAPKVDPAAQAKSLFANLTKPTQ